MRLSVLWSAIFLIATQVLGADSFQSAGSLLTPRADHNAVLLNNGKILIVGGAGTTAGLSSAFVATAELYDPATGTLTTTGTPLYHQHHATLTLLPSGKVLFAGGISDYIGHPYPFCPPEVYDPATGTWSAAPSMQTTHFMHTATLLQNGKVLVVGTDSGSGVNTKAELYDPAANTWTTTGSLTTGRQNHTATLLPDGKLLVVGGTGTSAFIASAELYDPTAGTWSSAGALTTGRYNHTATLLPNGKILVSGGNGSAGTLASSELYDPGTNSWSTTGSMAAARYSHQAALLPNGKVLAAGGKGSMTTAELYDPAAGTWSTTTSLATGRSDATATLLPSGAVVFAGGGDASGNAIASIELFTSATPAWSSTGSLAAMKSFHTSSLLPNGKVLVSGGYMYSGGTSTYYQTAELYDLASGSWAGTGSLSQGRSEHQAVLLPSGKVMAVGGISAGAFLTSTELYDPTSGTWSTSGSLKTYRYRFATALLPNGRVLALGGGSPFGMSGAELYDPAAGTWSSTGSLNTARQLHTATALPNGKVLAAGGSTNGYGDSAFTSCELYDPATAVWTNTGSMSSARQLHTATLLPNGKVLVAGGATMFPTNVPYASAEIFDPGTGTWSTTGSMAAARYNHQAILLPTGKVLVCGGNNASSFLTSAEIYDPASGVWSPAGNMASAHSAFCATLLPNGKAVISGGSSASSTYLAAAELFDPGQGYTTAMQPQISTATFNGAAQLVLAGSGFCGISGASSGGFMDSSTSYPMVQLRSMGNGQLSFLLPNSGSSLSSTAFTSSAVTGFPPGQALATVFANGIPGTSVMVVVPQPQSIAVEQPAGTGVANGGSKAFASTLVAATQTLTFSVKNSGGLALNISGVSVTGGNAADFAVSTSGMSSSLSSGSSTTFTVSFTPSAAGARSTTLQIISDDSVAPTYSISLSGTGLNNAPTITGLSDQTINEDSNTGSLSFTIGDVETAAGSLTLTGASSNTTLLPNANIVFGGTGASRTVTVAPAANQNGTATITVTVGDGTTTTNGTFVLTVTAVNDPPTLDAISNPAAILEDAVQQTVNLTGITAGPNESQSLVVTAASDNTALIPNPSVTYTSPGTTGSLKYTPVANASGTATITVTVNDGQAANNLFTRSFIVTVTAVNDPPTLDAIGNPAAILEDAGQQTINLTGITAGPNESQTLTVTATSSNTALIPDPAVSYASPSTTGALTYTPVANASGSAVITVTVNDGDVSNNTIVRTFTVNVTAVNDPPTITAISDQTIIEDASTGALDFTVGDVETAAASLTLTKASSNTTLVPLANIIFGGSGASRTATVTPAANQNGTATITVTVSDGSTTTSTSFLLTVTAVNDPPTLNSISNPAAILEDAGQQTVNLSGITAGPNETQILTVTATSDNTSLIPNPTVNYTSLSTTGSLNYTPVANANGTATITVTVNDGQASNNLFTQTFIVTVTAVNDPPTLDFISNPAAILEDAGAQSINLTGITAGPANEIQALTVTATSSNTALIPNPSVSYTSPATTGSLSYTPVANANGSAVITVTVNDGQAANNTFVRTFTVNVTAVNDAPTITTILDQTINEDGNTGPLAFTIGDVETSASVLTVTGVSSNKTLVPDANLVFGGSGASRTVTATPAANASGTTTITLTVSDGTTTSSSAFLLTVTAVNDPPTITDITDQVITYNTLTNALPFTIDDVETDAASLTVTATSSNLALLPNENIFLGGSGAARTLTAVPNFNQVGTSTVTVTVGDGTTTTSDTFVLTVNAPDIVVEQPFNTSISSGGTKDFGNVLVGGSTSLVFFVKNITASNLTGLNLTLNGADAAMFTIISTPVAPVAGPNGATAFTIRFNPTSAGAKTAAIHLSSNDPDENPFDITLTGTGMSALDSWRQTNFGSLLDAGNSANTADPDHDGIPNLLEYAFGSNPLQSGGSLIPKPQFNGSTIVFSFNEPSGVSGASYAAEWSRTLDAASWSTSGFNDSGSGGTHVFTLSVNPADGPMFVRIRVSQP